MTKSIAGSWRSWMLQTQTFLCVLTSAILVPAQYAHAQVVTWNFDTATAIGTPPAQWEDASQAGSPASFQCVANAPMAGTNSLYIKAAANSWDRVKVRTTASFTTGTYTWRVYVPPLGETGASSVIAGFLYSQQSTSDTDAREADFEICYGTAANRATYGVPAGHVMCVMSVQQDNSSGTGGSLLWFQPTDPADHILPENWYTLVLTEATNGAGRYVTSWTIQREGGAVMAGRAPYTAGYGPAGAAATNFQVYCSVENMSGLWAGDHQPTTDQTAYFDSVSFANNAAAPVEISGFSVE